jgi:hypothetical protein
MVPESYFGIDIVDGKWLVVAQWQEGKNLLCRRFENTTDGLTSLSRFIRDRAVKPRMCVKLNNRAALSLALHLGSLPRAEVILLSQEGLHQNESRLRHMGTKEEGSIDGVEVLARAAERMI